MRTDAGNSARPDFARGGHSLFPQGATFSLSEGLFIERAIVDSIVKAGRILTWDPHAIAGFKPTVYPGLSDHRLASVLGLNRNHPRNERIQL